MASNLAHLVPADPEDPLQPFLHDAEKVELWLLRLSDEEWNRHLAKSGQLATLLADSPVGVNAQGDLVIPDAKLRGAAQKLMQRIQEAADGNTKQ